jgi:2-phosphosulfolactate phosphatase
MTAARVAGKTVLLTTTNGSAALLATHGARRVLVAAFVNLSVTAGAVRRAMDEGRDVLVVCAGQNRRFALEDAVCSGALVAAVVRGRRGVTVGDGGTMARQLWRRYQANPDRLARDASHAVSLAAAGFAEDVAFCLARDTVPILATYADRQVTNEPVIAAA